MAYGTMGGEGQPQTQAALFTRYARFGTDLAAIPRRAGCWAGHGAISTTLKIEDGLRPNFTPSWRGGP
jgi:gamma-glutamyltranspeptidase/glutathione hydrolase